MIILYAILFILLLIGLWLLMLYLYQKEFIEWHNGGIRGCTKEAEKHKLARDIKCNCIGCSNGERCTKEIRIDIEKEFRKLDKVKNSR